MIENLIRIKIFPINAGRFSRQFKFCSKSSKSRTVGFLSPNCRCNAIPETARSERASHPAEIEFHQLGEVYRRRRTNSKLLQSLPLSLALSIRVPQLSRTHPTRKSFSAATLPSCCEKYQRGLVNTAATILTATSS